MRSDPDEFAPALEEKPFPWLELAEILFRRRLWVIAGVIVGLLGSVANVLRAPDRYSATATVLLTADAMTGPREKGMTPQQIETELALLRSHSLIREVLKGYRAQNPVANAEARPSKGRSQSGLRSTVRAFVDRLLQSDSEEPAEKPDPLAGVARSIANRIELKPIARSNLITVSLKGSNPRWVSGFVNDLLKAHVERIKEQSKHASERSFYEEQGDRAAERLSAARHAISNFWQRDADDPLGFDEKQLRSGLNQLLAARLDAETHVMELSAKVRYLRQSLGQQAPAASDGPIFIESGSTRTQEPLRKLNLERSDLLSRYAPTHPRVRDVERRIVWTERLLQAEPSSEPLLAEPMDDIDPTGRALQLQLVQAEAELVAAETLMSGLSGQIDQYQESLAEVGSNVAELARLEDGLTAANEAYASYVRKSEQARLASALDERGMVNLRIWDQAEVPTNPLPTKKRRTILLGLFVGLFVGIGCGFARDWIDPSVKSAAHAARVSGLPVIAEIPAE